MNTDKDKKNIKLVTLPQVKDYLEKLDAETSDQIQRRTLDYISKFAKHLKKMLKTLRKDS